MVFRIWSKPKHNKTGGPVRWVYQDQQLLFWLLLKWARSLGRSQNNHKFTLTQNSKFADAQVFKTRVETERVLAGAAHGAH